NRLSGNNSVPPPTSSGGSSVGVGEGSGLLVGLAEFVDSAAVGSDELEEQPASSSANVTTLAITPGTRRMNTLSWVEVRTTRFSISCPAGYSFINVSPTSGALTSVSKAR